MFYKKLEWKGYNLINMDVVNFINIINTYMHKNQLNLIFIILYTQGIQHWKGNSLGLVIVHLDHGMANDCQYAINP